MNSMKNELAADETTLKSTVDKCTKNEEGWDQRSKVRAGEIEAMKMACKILSKVSGVRNPDEHEIPKKALVASNASVNSLEEVVEDVGNAAGASDTLSFLQEGNARDESPKEKIAASCVRLARQPTPAQCRSLRRRLRPIP